MDNSVIQIVAGIGVVLLLFIVIQRRRTKVR